MSDWIGAEEARARLGVRPQPVVEGHAWIDKAVVDALFDKYWRAEFCRRRG